MNVDGIWMFMPKTQEMISIMSQGQRSKVNSEHFTHNSIAGLRHFYFEIGTALPPSERKRFKDSSPYQRGSRSVFRDLLGGKSGGSTEGT